LPYTGVATVSARRYAVTTHARWSSPPSSPVIVGRAVATIVWSIAARSMPSMIPEKTMSTWRRGSPAAVGTAADTGDVTSMRFLVGRGSERLATL
jgi:hypothetical protein